MAGAPNVEQAIEQSSCGEFTETVADRQLSHIIAQRGTAKPAYQYAKVLHDSSAKRLCNNRRLTSAFFASYETIKSPAHRHLSSYASESRSRFPYDAKRLEPSNCSQIDPLAASSHILPSRTSERVDRSWAAAQVKSRHTF